MGGRTGFLAQPEINCDCSDARARSRVSALGVVEFGVQTIGVLSPKGDIVFYGNVSRGFGAGR